MSQKRSDFRRSRSWLAPAAAVAALGFMFIGSSASRAAVLVNDTWKDGLDSDPAAPNYSENGTDSDDDGDLESIWLQGGAGTLDPVGPNGPLRGNLTAGGTSSATWTTYFTPESSPVSLAKGDTLRLTWKFTPTTVNATNTSQNFRLALMDSPAAQRISANGSPGSGAYTGYAIFANMGGTLGNGSSFQLKERIVASGDTLGTSGNWGANGVSGGLANGATNGAHGYDDGTLYTLVWDLTRKNDDTLDITATMSGGTLDNDGSATFTVNDPSPQGFTYDMFQIRPSGATTTAELFDTSLFKVEVLVPEPSSLAGIGLAGLALANRSRRRCRR
jgi:hypothetical protein